MQPISLSDRQWAAIAPKVPPAPPTGRPRADERRCLEAVLSVLLLGCGWHDLRGPVAPTTAWRALRSWQDAGAWPRIWARYLGTLDAAGRRAWSRALLAGAFVPAHRRERHGARSPRRRVVPHAPRSAATDSDRIDPRPATAADHPRSPVTSPADDL